MLCNSCLMAAAGCWPVRFFGERSVCFVAAAAAQAGDKRGSHGSGLDPLDLESAGWPAAPAHLVSFGRKREDKLRRPAAIRASGQMME